MATTMLKTDVFFRNAKLALVAAGLLATMACSRGNVHAAAPAMPPPLVTAVPATTQDVPRYLDEIGRNAAFEAVTVTPQVSGRIVERHFQDGENLRRGQLLFVIPARGRRARNPGLFPVHGRVADRSYYVYVMSNLSRTRLASRKFLQMMREQELSSKSTHASQSTLTRR